MQGTSVSQWTRGTRFILGTGFTDRTDVRYRRLSDPPGSEVQSRYQVRSPECIRVYDDGVDAPLIYSIIEKGSDTYELVSGKPELWTFGASRGVEAGELVEAYGVNLHRLPGQPGPVPGGLLIGDRKIELDATSYDTFVTAMKAPSSGGAIPDKAATLKRGGSIGGKSCAWLVTSPGYVEIDETSRGTHDAILGIADGVSGVEVRSSALVNYVTHKPAFGILTGRAVTDLLVRDSLIDAMVAFEPMGTPERWTIELNDLHCTVGPRCRSSIGRILGREIVFRRNHTSGFCQGLLGVNERPYRIAIHDNDFDGHHRAGSSEVICFEQRGESMRPTWGGSKASDIAIFRNQFRGNCGIYLTANMQHVYLRGNHHEHQRSAIRLGQVRQSSLKVYSQADHVLIRDAEMLASHVVIDANRDLGGEAVIRGLLIDGGLWSDSDIHLNALWGGKQNTKQEAAMHVAIERCMFGDTYTGNFPSIRAKRPASKPVCTMSDHGVDLYHSANFWDDDFSKRLDIVAGNAE